MRLVFVGRLFALAVFMATSLVGRAAFAPSAPRKTFAHDVEPLLARACLNCHGPVKQRGGLRLDQLNGLAEVVVPGQASESALWLRVKGATGDERMPLDAPPLSVTEIATIKRWIDGGAPEIPQTPPRHWAYRPAQRPTLPQVRDQAWSHNPIDRFVAADLAAHEAAPAPQAAPETLLRRVYLDLTGLPPGLDDIDAFLADKSPLAYERVVDRLLASPLYGERFAVPWLDAAHYADSNGYEKDRRREAWLFRDWVVNALNEDLPFDEFVLRQIAGDRLPGATDNDRIATGFLRTPQTNEEGGVDPDEARWQAVVDRVVTVGTVFLGATLACAQCHDHKHDPISQREFFKLFAYLDEARETQLAQPNAAQAVVLSRLEPEIKRLHNELQTWTPQLGVAQTHWEKSLHKEHARWTVCNPDKLASVAGASLASQPDGSIIAGPTSLEHDEHVIEAKVDLSAISAIRIEALPDSSLPNGGPGRGHAGSFFLGGVSVEAGPRGDNSTLRPVALVRALSDEPTLTEPQRYEVRNLTAAEVFEETLGTGDGRGWGVSPVMGEPAFARQAVLFPVAPFGFQGGTRLRIRLRYPSYTRAEVMGRFRLSVTEVSDPETAVALQARLRSLVARQPSERTKREQDELAEAFRQITPLLHTQRSRYEHLLAERDALGVVTTLVATPAPVSNPLTALVRVRGAFAQPGDQVTAGLPRAFLNGGSPPLHRTELARWLVSRNNPLAARVLANRMWAHHFGRGLVETVDDFGTQGAPPSHPELLDWLAVELIEQGWRQKAIHRMIVTSATYKQSSQAEPPSNAELWLAHGPRFRLDAEVLRDQALFLGGLLNTTRGGPPVFPPRTDGNERLPNSDEVAWPASGDQGNHRRSLYTFVRRTRPYPLSALFDAPSRETCNVKRDRSNTPMQALATLNAPVFWEAARGLAGRMQSFDKRTRPAIAFGFRAATGRLPMDGETDRLEQLYQRQLKRLAQERATSPAQWPDEAMTLVANVILNLDETLTLQ